MPRGVKKEVANEEVLKEAEAIVVDEKEDEEVNEAMMNSVAPENSELTEVTDPTMEGYVNPETENVEENKEVKEESKKDAKEEKGSKEDAKDEEKEPEFIPEYVAETTLTGNFKVYRGRNYATITALATSVTVDGEEIVENGTAWLPVVFKARSGNISKGYIVR